MKWYSKKERKKENTEHTKCVNLKEAKDSAFMMSSEEKKNIAFWMSRKKKKISVFQNDLRRFFFYIPPV